MQKLIAVIPSRYAAQRFPGKPLTLIAGKPMVQQVFERCQEAGCFARVIIATDDERIAAAAKAFGAEVAMTSPSCASGTDRVAEAARLSPGSDGDVFVNVQGDEPAIHPASLKALAPAFDDPSVAMATLVRPLKEEERKNPNVVKVVLDEQGRALYFSREDIPHQREGSPAPQRLAHLGIYGYRRATLLKLAAWAPTLLERSESLEQLRALGNGVRIVCCLTPHSSQAVDRPEDVPLAEAAVRAVLKR